MPNDAMKLTISVASQGKSEMMLYIQLGMIRNWMIELKIANMIENSSFYKI